MIFQGNVLPISKNGEFISTHAFFYDITDLEYADQKNKTSGINFEYGF